MALTPSPPSRGKTRLAVNLPGPEVVEAAESRWALGSWRHRRRKGPSCRASIGFRTRWSFEPVLFCPEEPSGANQPDPRYLYSYPLPEIRSWKTISTPSPEPTWKRWPEPASTGFGCTASSAPGPLPGVSGIRQGLGKAAAPNSLVEHALGFGIRIYLYLNEPMPASFFDRHPDIKGSPYRRFHAMCTSVPRVRRWIAKVSPSCGRSPTWGDGFPSPCRKTIPTASLTAAVGAGKLPGPRDVPAAPNGRVGR